MLNNIVKNLEANKIFSYMQDEYYRNAVVIRMHVKIALTCLNIVYVIPEK